MITEPRAYQEAAEAAEALEPESGILGTLDPLTWGEAFGRLALGLARNPASTFLAGARFATGLAAASFAARARLFGAPAAGPIMPDSEDRRFSDPAWEQNPFFYALEQAHLLTRRLFQELVAAARLEPQTALKAELALGLLSDATAPTNYLWSNPAALKRAFDTGGTSVARGFANFLQDLAENGGMPRQVDTSSLRVGKELAATPGKVVFRNDLMELIQYEPQTDTVYETPLLLSPPWINKYYVMDLAPGRSFAEWAVTRGHTVFALSYRNPDESLRDFGLDDYLIHGPRTALDVMQDVTGAPHANVVGLCLGGSLTAMLVAYLAGVGDDRVHAVTLLNTLVDFSEPGQLGAFTDPASVRRLERKMAKRGYLEGSEMARTFNLLRANDLIFNYVASNWLMGESPPAFDILAWNADATRMPAAMHSFYLRACYLENQLARGEMELVGKKLDLAQARQDVYLLAAREDHIAPWRTSYKGTQLFGGDVRFVLTSSGHIAGIVNPPSPKRLHWTRDNGLPPDPEEWLAGAEEHVGSWWEDWAEWIAARAGERREPPPLGSERYPPLGDAPGSYAHET